VSSLAHWRTIALKHIALTPQGADAVVSAWGCRKTASEPQIVGTAVGTIPVCTHSFVSSRANSAECLRKAEIEYVCLAASKHVQWFQWTPIYPAPKLHEAQQRKKVIKIKSATIYCYYGQYNNQPINEEMPKQIVSLPPSLF
jgi:hypothetical protein